MYRPHGFQDKDQLLETLDQHAVRTRASRYDDGPFGIEPAERDSNAERAQTVEDVRTGKTPIQVNIDCHNDDNFITGTVTVGG